MADQNQDSSTYIYYIFRLTNLSVQSFLGVSKRAKFIYGCPLDKLGQTEKYIDKKWAWVQGGWTEKNLLEGEKKNVDKPKTWSLI